MNSIGSSDATRANITIFASGYTFEYNPILSLQFWGMREYMWVGIITLKKGPNKSYASVRGSVVFETGTTVSGEVREKRLRTAR